MRPSKLKLDEKLKKFIVFVDLFFIGDIFFNNVQISLKKKNFVASRTLFAHYIVSQIITCEVSIVKNSYIYIHIYDAGATLSNYNQGQTKIPWCPGL